jgi:hypothetical protein
MLVPVRDVLAETDVANSGHVESILVKPAAVPPRQERIT